jgi:hypothetical protein
MNKHTVKKSLMNLKFLPRGRFIIACAVLTFFNLLVLYFFPRNIYTDILFVLTVFFAFKFLGFSGINIFFYSIIYLIIAAVITLINNYIILYKWSGSTSFYVLALFILAILTYLYEQKLEFRIRAGRKKIAYLSLCIFFILTFLASTAFININDTKIYFFNKFYTEKYFDEIEVIDIGGKDIYNKMSFFIEKPRDNLLIKDIFTIEGWAIDESEIAGTEIDYVAVYLDNKPGDGGKIIGRGQHGILREDLAETKGEQFEKSGFWCRIDSNRIEDGIRKFYVYFHSNNFGWKYDLLELFIHNNDTYILKDMLDKENEDIEFKYSSMSVADDAIIIEEGSNVLKSVKFPVAIESGKDYLISFKIKKLSNLDNAINFDFMGNGYDNPEQEFNIGHVKIYEHYSSINRLINTGEVPPGTDTYFRIFTSSGGSVEIKDLSIYKIIKRQQ